MIASLFMLLVGCVFAYGVYRLTVYLNTPKEDDALLAKNALTTPERLAYIRQATTVGQLDDALYWWRGLSNTGVLYSEILMRKEEITGGLSDEEALLLEESLRLQEEGSKLPPIEGRGRM